MLALCQYPENPPYGKSPETAPWRWRARLVLVRGDEDLEFLIQCDHRPDALHCSSAVLSDRGCRAGRWHVGTALSMAALAAGMAAQSPRAGLTLSRRVSSMEAKGSAPRMTCCAVQQAER